MLCWVRRPCTTLHIVHWDKSNVNVVLGLFLTSRSELSYVVDHEFVENLSLVEAVVIMFHTGVTDE